MDDNLSGNKKAAALPAARGINEIGVNGSNVGDRWCVLMIPFREV